MATGIGSGVYLPDGQFVTLPPLPRTWVDEATGTPGDWLRARWLEHDAGGGVVWHRQKPLFQGIQTVAQAIPTGTWTAITGLAEIIDNYQGHSDSTNTGRWYAPQTSTSAANGDWYLVNVSIPYLSTTGADVFVAGWRETGGSDIWCGIAPSGAGHDVTVQGVDLVQMTGTDYLELMGWQNSGASVNTIVTGPAPSMTVRWVCIDPANAAATTPALPSVHTWAPTDLVTGSATGGAKVPLNVQLRDAVNYLNNPPICRIATNGTAQTIPSGSGTWTSISFTGENVDNYNGWVVATPTVYTCQRAGVYLVAGLAVMSDTATNTGYRAARLLHTIAAGGSETFPGDSTVPATSVTTGTGLGARAYIRMAVGDTVALQVQQTQGAALSLNSGATSSSRMIVVWRSQ